jgi:DHA1 family tetracycline resistance protein-like MFS transporter
MKLTKMHYVLLAIRFSENLGYAITIPVIPFIAKTLGVNDIFIGLIFGVYAFFQLIAGPIMGYISDKWGRKYILIVSQLGTIIGYILIGISSNYLVLLLSRVVDGLTGGNFALINSVVLDHFEKKEQERVFRLLSTAAGVAILVGPFLGSVLIGYSIGILVFVSATISVITLLITIVWFEEMHSSAQTQPLTVAGLIKPLKNQTTRSLFYLKFGKDFILNAFLTGIPIFTFYLLDFDAEESSLLLSIFFFFAFIYQITFLKYTLRIQNKINSLRLALIFSLVGVIVNILFRNYEGLIIMGMLFMFGITVLEPLFNIMVGQRAGDKEKGCVMGISQFVSSLGQISGPLVIYLALFFFQESGFLFTIFLVCIILLVSTLGYHYKDYAKT